jgi:hypothetical protein
VFKSLNDRKVAECVSLVRRMASEVRSPDFDFEAANNFLAVLARLRLTEIQLPDSDMWVATAANRFCVSKAATELLCKAAQNFEPYELALREAQTRVAQISEKAIARSVQGTPGEAVRTLLVAGAETLNAKLIELAGMVLNRHRERIEDVDETAEMIDDLKSKFCKQGTQVNLGHSNGRSAGSLQLRTRGQEGAQPTADAPGVEAIPDSAQAPEAAAQTLVPLEEPTADEPSVDELVALIDGSSAETSPESLGFGLATGEGAADLSDAFMDLDPQPLIDPTGAALVAAQQP